MAIASNFPTVDPSLLLDFANTKRLDSRVTFTRTTTATYYDGVTTAMAEQNLILESQALNSSSWSRGSTTVSDNSVAAPDGTTTASTATTSAAGSSLRTIAITVQPSTTYTFSFFALRGTMSDLKYSIYNNTAASDIVAPTSYYASTNASTWSRLSFTFTTPAGCTSIFCFLLRDSIATGTVFLWGAQLEQRSSVTSYTATTTQAITNYIPVLLTAASGVARFDHNPTTDESLGLLIEEARTNLALRSDDFANATWVKAASSITSNTIVAPDGTLTGDKLVEDTTNANHTVRQPITVTSGTTYTFSCFIKAGERTECAVEIFTGATVYRAVFNLLTGAFISSTGTGSYNVSSVGNGWFRISITAAASTTTLNPFIYTSSGGTISYTGNGYSGIFLWGAQLEEGAFPTSYIATTAATVTRNADAASMTGTNFTSWYNQGEGTLYAQYQPPITGLTRGAVAISDGTNNNRMIIRGMTTTSTTQFIGVNSGTTQWNDSFSTATATSTKSIFAYATNNIAFSRNGVTPLTDTTATIPTVNQLRIGADGDGTFLLNGPISRIVYYPLRLTNANLQALTS